jgi:hypothetical protein
MMTEETKAEFLKRRSAEALPRKSGCLPMALFVMVAATVCGALSMIYIGFALVFFAAVGLILFQFLVFWPLLRKIRSPEPQATQQAEILVVEATSLESRFTPLQGFLAGGSVSALAPFVVGAILAGLGIPWEGYSSSANTFLILGLFLMGGMLCYAFLRLRK